MKKLLFSFMTALLALSPSAGLILAPATTQAATINSLIKGSSPTVYWYASNGKRYVFPNIKTFYTWYSIQDLSRVQTLSDQELSTIALGGNVTYRPGAKLVKVATDPKVYAVSRYGVLRWVTSEYVARTLYGSNWTQWVEDVPDTFFTNYTIGAAIYNASDYNVSNEYNQVQTPSDSLSTTYNSGYYNNSYNYGYNNGFYSNTALTGSITRRTMNGSFESVDYTATLTNSNSSNQGITIQIYNESTGQQLWSCSNTASCTTSLSGSYQQTAVLYARATDQQGRTIESSRITLLYGSSSNQYYNNNYSNTFNGNLSVNADRSSVGYNDTVTFTATLSNIITALQNTQISLYDAYDDRLVRTCSQSYTCATSVSGYNRSGSNMRFYAIATDSYGNQSVRAYSPTVVVSGSSSFSGNAYVTLSDVVPSTNGTTRVQINTYVSNLQGYYGNLTTTIYDERDNSVVYTFSNCNPSCVTSQTATHKPGYNNTFRYYAIIRDQNNYQLSTVYSDYLTVQPATYDPGNGGYTASLSLNPNYTSFPQSGTNELRLSAAISNLSTSLQGVTTNIYEVGNATALATCVATTNCVFSNTQTYTPVSITRQYYASLIDNQGNLIARSSTISINFQPNN